MRTAPDPSQQIFRATLGWKLFYALLSLGSSIIFLFPIVVLFIIPLVTNHPIFIPIGPAIGLIAFIFLIGTTCNLLLFLAFRKVYHVISPAGVEYHTLDLHIYTPWHNIIRVEPRPLGIYNPPSLILKEPAVPGNLEEGKRQGIATIRVPWYAAKDKTRRESIPLLFTVPRTDWRACELGAAIRHYAPQALDPILDGTPVQQALHRRIKTKTRLLVILYFITILLLPSLILSNHVVQTVFATLVACFWLLVPGLIVYALRKRQRAKLRKTTIIYILLYNLFMLCASILNLAYLYSWLHDPISAFINYRFGTPFLFGITLVASGPFIYGPLLSRLTAKETQQLEALQTTQR